MFHETINSVLSAALNALESYPRVSGVVLGLATGRMIQALASLVR